jgi:hypothetical protein
VKTLASPQYFSAFEAELHFVRQMISGREASGIFPGRPSGKISAEWEAYRSKSLNPTDIKILTHYCVTGIAGGSSDDAPALPEGSHCRRAGCKPWPPPL